MNVHTKYKFAFISLLDTLKVSLTFILHSVLRLYTSLSVDIEIVEVLTSRAKTGNKIKNVDEVQDGKDSFQA